MYTKHLYFILYVLIFYVFSVNKQEHCIKVEWKMWYLQMVEIACYHKDSSWSSFISWSSFLIFSSWFISSVRPLAFCSLSLEISSSFCNIIFVVQINFWNFYDFKNVNIQKKLNYLIQDTSILLCPSEYDTRCHIK